VPDSFKDLGVYYTKWCTDNALILKSAVKALSTEILVSQKSTSWYLYLDWRGISEEEFIGLSLIINFIELSDSFRNGMTEMELYIYKEFKEQFLSCALRFRHSSKGKVWVSIITREAYTSIYYMCINNILLPITEWNGNYNKLEKRRWIQEHFTLRYNTPRRQKKQERIRGYRDHGSMASVSEKARRAANTSPIRGVTQEGFVENWTEYQSSLRFIEQQKETGNSS